MKPLIFIVGPTAVGKTKWAIEWAEKSQAGLLNCDSIQAYKELKIGSAKPDFEKYPYIDFYLFDEMSPPQVWTAGDFRKKAFDILKNKLPRQKILAVGGSGFYIQALEKGMYFIKNKVELESFLKETPIQRLKRNGRNMMKQSAKSKKREEEPVENRRRQNLDELYKNLKKKDPERARQIHPQDKYRILRSLNLIESEGKTFSQIKKEFKKQKLPWPYIKIGLNLSKANLLKKVEKRTKSMLKKGLIEEVEILVKKGFRAWRPLGSVGYRESLLYIEGKIKKEELFEQIVSRTMHLAKKQKTWFKKDKSIKWFDGNESPLKVYKKIFK